MRRLPLWLFAGAAALELAGIAADLRVLQWIAKPLLAPILIWYLMQNRRPGAVVAALAFATAGDVVLLVPGTVPFLIGMGCFLGTQACLAAAFLRRSRPPLAAMAGYALLWAGLNALLWGHLGALRGPILGYSLALAAMAAAAAGVSARVGVGGALFLASDLLIGVGAAGMGFAGRDLAVMATYAAALALIATGWAGTAPQEPAPEAVAGVGGAEIPHREPSELGNSA